VYPSPVLRRMEGSAQVLIDRVQGNADVAAAGSR